MPQRVEGTIEIDAPVERVYDYWENLENLPHFMTNVEEVRETMPDQTHWKIKGPFGAEVEFDARTTQKEENTSIAWNSTDGDVGTSGEVRFQDAGEGRTRLEVVMNYADPPGGKAGEAAARLLADPQVLVQQDLRNLKDILEGRATPEEVRQRPAAANVQSGAVASLTSGTGLLILGVGGLLFLLLRRGRKPDRKLRFIIEL